MPKILLSILLVFAQGLALADENTQRQDEQWAWKAAVVSSIALTLALNPLKADSAGLGIGTTNDGAAAKLIFRWMPEHNAAQWGPIAVKPYMHVAYGRWQSSKDSTQTGANNVLEVVPIFRLGWSEQSWLSYLETSVGVSVLSQSHFNDLQFGSNFQFTDSMSVGGYGGEWDWSLQYQHYSNNSIKLPNDGINFYVFNLTHKY